MRTTCYELHNRKVICLDGDGAAIMHLGALSTIGTQKPQNMIHIVLNNGSHDSVGGQPTVGRKINLCPAALACGYDHALSVVEPEALLSNLQIVFASAGTVFIEVIVSKGSRPDLGRPTSSPIENKKSFMELLEE